MITKVEIEISNDPISGLKRKMKHFRFEINENLEMEHWRKIILYEKIDDGSPEGAYGRPILQVISEDPTLSPESKKLKSQLYADQYVSVNTTGVMVNPLTGQPSSQEGSIPELEFWQSLPIAFINPLPDKVSGAIYTLLGMSMKSADNNGRV